MNKKPFDLATIENELKGASLFFPTTETAEHPSTPSGDRRREQAKVHHQAMPPSPQRARRPAAGGAAATTLKTNTNDSHPSEESDTTTPSHRDTTVSRHHASMPPATVEAIRKAVKLVGKEAATHRFTPEEKQAIADIIYTYRRQGCDTSENEIARIAINWLVWDHQAHGEASILAHVLKALNE